MALSNPALLAGAISAFVCVPTAFAQGAPVVINEFAYDDSGTDDLEFVELYNNTAVPFDISGWTLQSADSAYPGDNNLDVTVPAGTMLAPGDYYVFGMAAVPNVDQVVTPVGQSWLENSREAITLLDTNGRIVDTVMYEVGASGSVWDPMFAEGDDGIWGGLITITSGGLLGPQSQTWSRCRDGVDTNNNGYDFRTMPATPGTSNDLSLTYYFDDFNAAAVGSNPPTWIGSFAAPTVVDPTVIDTVNLNAIPASPDGGNAAMFWDSSGGGNTHMLLLDCCTATTLECWAYIDATPLTSAAGDYESWSVGLGNGEGYRYNDPDPSGALVATANGNTGISWTYQRIGGAATIYLIDHNDGGWGAGAVSGPTILGSIAITAGRNDGWQRLRIDRNGTAVTGYFGGTWGSTTDGVRYSGQITDRPLAAWCGYREFTLDNTTLRPLTMDRILVKCCGRASTSISATCPPAYHNGNGPVLSFGAPPNDLPRIGGAIDIVGSNLLGSPFCGLLMGMELFTPIAMAPYGGLPNGLLCINPVYATAGCSGGPTTTVTLPIPNTPAVCDTVVSFQWLDYDTSLAAMYPLAYGTSGVGTVKVGL